PRKETAMNGPIRTLLLTIALALMTTAAAAQDLPSDRFGPPLILRLKGVVEPTPEAARHTDGFAVVSLGFLGDGAPARRWPGAGGGKPGHPRTPLHAAHQTTRSHDGRTDRRGAPPSNTRISSRDRCTA